MSCSLLKGVAVLLLAAALLGMGVSSVLGVCQAQKCKVMQAMQSDAQKHQCYGYFQDENGQNASTNGELVYGNPDGGGSLAKTGSSVYRKTGTCSNVECNHPAWPTPATISNLEAGHSKMDQEDCSGT